MDDPKQPVADTALPEGKVLDNKDPIPEIGGGKGLDPTRYGDWEIGGKCVDF
jgi:hypothetical protein